MLGLPCILSPAPVQSQSAVWFATISAFIHHPCSYSTEEEARDPGLTFNLLHEHLVKRIDYIFLKLQDDSEKSKRFKLESASVVPAYVHGDSRGAIAGSHERCTTRYRNPFPSSDHLGLLIELSRP